MAIRDHIFVCDPGQKRIALRGAYEAAGQLSSEGGREGPVEDTRRVSRGIDQFYITSTTGESARIYPMKVWSGIEDKLAGVSSQNRAKRKFLMRTSYYGQTVELDGQGRVLVPAVLRESAQMKGEVDVFGNLDYLEVMNHTRVLDDLKNSPYTEEDDKALEDLGI